MSVDNYYKKDSHGYMDLADDLFAEYVFKQIERHAFGLIPFSQKAIEIGCGMGRFSVEVVKRFESVDLVEPSTDFFTRLKEKFAEKEKTVSVYHQTASAYFANRNETNDTTVFTFHLLHHLSRGERVELFRQIAKRQLKAVFVEPNPYNPLILVQILTHPDMTYEEEKDYLKLTRKGMGEELKQAGIHRFIHQRICFMPPFVCDVLLHNGLAGVLGVIDKLCTFVPFMPSYQLFYVDPERNKSHG